MIHNSTYNVEQHRRREKSEERGIDGRGKDAGRESLKLLKLKVLLNTVTQSSVKFLYRIYFTIRRIIFATEL